MHRRPISAQQLYACPLIACLHQRGWELRTVRGRSIDRLTVRASGRVARWFFNSWIFHVIRLVLNYARVYRSWSTLVIALRWCSSALPLTFWNRHISHRSAANAAAHVRISTCNGLNKRRHHNLKSSHEFVTNEFTISQMTLSSPFFDISLRRSLLVGNHEVILKLFRCVPEFHTVDFRHLFKAQHAPIQNAATTRRDFARSGGRNPWWFLTSSLERNLCL